MAERHHLTRLLSDGHDPWTYKPTHWTVACTCGPVATGLPDNATARAAWEHHQKEVGAR